MSTITIYDVDRKYWQALEGINACMEIVEGNGSSQEFLREFRSVAEEYPSAELLRGNSNIFVWDKVLSEKVSSFRDKLVEVFGTKDALLAEALTQ